jgi:hypothetical protein
VTELSFLIDEDLIALGRSLASIYPDEIYISGQRGAPALHTDDRKLYPWCIEHDAILVTYDWNMLRDEKILTELIRVVGIRVLWIDQVKGEPSRKAFTRIVGRWEHIRRVVSEARSHMGFVLAGNNELRQYETISDTVVEVVRKASRRRKNPLT